MYTVSEENYIKSIYHLQQGNKSVLTNDLANALQTKPASVTDMLKKLQAKKLLDYEKYYGVKLTGTGKKLALAIIRRHRLWEFFLVEHLKFGWDEVHEIAEQLEHVQSLALTDKLDAYMNFPRFDPHGDPIPDNTGKMEVQPLVGLVQVKPGQKAIIAAIGEQSSDLFEMMKHKRMAIGTELVVVQTFAYDKSLELDIEGRHETVSRMLAGNIYVKEI